MNEGDKIPTLIRTIKALLNVLPDSNHYIPEREVETETEYGVNYVMAPAEGEDWGWCWEELYGDSQEQVKYARAQAEKVLAEIGVKRYIE